jgi:hypothetical protein
VNKTELETVDGGQPMLRPLRAVANKCASGQCPTVYTTATGSVVVQGFALTGDQAGVDLPHGEMLVEIPFDLLAEAVRNLA